MSSFAFTESFWEITRGVIEQMGFWTIEQLGAGKVLVTRI